MTSFYVLQLQSHLPCKLSLRVGNILKISAALHECINLGKYSGIFQMKSSRGMLSLCMDHIRVGFLPSFTTPTKKSLMRIQQKIIKIIQDLLNRLINILLCGDDKTIENPVNINVPLTSDHYFLANLLK